MLLGLWCLLHPGGPGVQMTQGGPHHHTRALGPDKEPGGSSKRDLAVWSGVVEQVSLHSGAFPGTLTLGSPEGTLGAAPHGGQQRLWFVVAWAEGCRVSHSPPGRLGQPQPPSPGSKRAACRFGGQQDATLIFIIHDGGINPSKEGISAQLVAVVVAWFGVFAVVVVVKM